MTRQIHCLKCSKNVGEIRDAKLAKGLCYLCQSCANELMVPPKMWDGFNDLFQPLGKNNGK